jgi:hypothetical protein
MPIRAAIRFSIIALTAFCAAVLISGVANAAELVMFRSDGCPWCAKWDREIGPIYPKTEFNSRAPLRQVNLDHDAAPGFIHAPIHYTPTFVLVKDGKEVGRIEGYPGDEFFWARLENLLTLLPAPVSPPALPQGISAPAPALSHPDRRL